MTINDKIKQVLTIRNLSPSHLADDIGVQRSSISHILSGRTRPSLDIIQRIVRRFPEFTYDWFLEEDLQMAPERNASTEPMPTLEPVQVVAPSPADTPAASTANADQPTFPTSLITEANKTVDRILLFYTDGTFQECKPTSRQ